MAFRHVIVHKEDSGVLPATPKAKKKVRACLYLFLKKANEALRIGKGFSYVNRLGNTFQYVQSTQLQILAVKTVARAKRNGARSLLLQQVSDVRWITKVVDAKKGKAGSLVVCSRDFSAEQRAYLCHGFQSNHAT